MASPCLPAPHTPTLTALLHAACESDSATQWGNDAMEYCDSFETAKSLGGTVREFGAHVEK